MLLELVELRVAPGVINGTVEEVLKDGKRICVVVPEDAALDDETIVADVDGLVFTELEEGTGGGGDLNAG